MKKKNENDEKIKFDKTKTSSEINLIDYYKIL